MCVTCLPRKGPVTRMPGAEPHARVFRECVCSCLPRFSRESPSPSCFPTSLSPFQAARGAELSPREPELCLCSGLGGWGGREQMTPSVSFQDRADLEPRAKAREASHPWSAKELPLQPPLPGLSQQKGEGKSQIWEPGDPQFKGIPHPKGPRPWPLFIRKVPSPYKLQRPDSKSAVSVI